MNITAGRALFRLYHGCWNGHYHSSGDQRVCVNATRCYVCKSRLLDIASNVPTVYDAGLSGKDSGFGLMDIERELAVLVWTYGWIPPR